MEGKRMKKALMLILAAGMSALLLSACGNSNSAQPENQTDTTPQTSQSTVTDENHAAASDSRILVAYFTHEGNNVFDGDSTDVDAITSASVQRDGDSFPPQVIDGVHKGNTQIIADYITEITGGDSFAIQVVDEAKYPVDGYDTLDAAQVERSENARPELAAHVENMDDYDVIYLGFPNWWGTMPMPVFTFLEEYDFSGKTIIPFCTHDGSGLGSSRRDIESLCPDATVLDGLAIRYSDVQEARSDVENWIDGMN